MTFINIFTDPSPFWEHVARILETTIPIGIFIWNNRRKAKQEAAEKAEKDKKAKETQDTALREELNRKHRENQDNLEVAQTKLDAILFDQIYLVPHDHMESRQGLPPETPLTVGGIMRRPNGKKQ